MAQSAMASALKSGPSNLLAAAAYSVSPPRMANMRFGLSPAPKPTISQR